LSPVVHAAKTDSCYSDEGTGMRPRHGALSRVRRFLLLGDGASRPEPVVFALWGL